MQLIKINLRFFPLLLVVLVGETNQQVCVYSISWRVFPFCTIQGEKSVTDKRIIRMHPSSVALEINKKKKKKKPKSNVWYQTRISSVLIANAFSSHSHEREMSCSRSEEWTN